MTSYRLLDTQTGPHDPVIYTNPMIVGVAFTVTSEAWFEGFWYWKANSDAYASNPRAALWKVTDGPGINPGHTLAGEVVPGSSHRFGVLTGGQWNQVLFTPAIPLEVGATYIAAVAQNGDFADSTDWFAANEPAGITNGPLFGFGPGISQGGTSYLTPGGSAEPFGAPQGLFTTQGTDPSVTMPDTPAATGTDNFWVDVQVTDTNPATNGNVTWATQQVRAGIQNTLFGRQTARAVIGAHPEGIELEQTARARIQASPSATQQARGFIKAPGYYTHNQHAHARLQATGTVSQPARASIAAVFSAFATQSAKALIGAYVPPPPVVAPPTREALSLVLPGRVLDLRNVDNGFVVTSFDPGFAVVREAASDLPEQDGQFDVTQFLTARVVSLSASAAPTPSLSIRDVIDQLAPFLDPQARPQIVYRTLPGEPLRVLNARVFQGSAPIVTGLSQVQVQWKVPDGVAYGMEDESGDLPASTTSPGFSFPVSYPRSYGDASEEAPPRFLQVSGTYRTWPVLRFYGPCTAPAVTWIDPAAGVALGPKVVFKSTVTIGDGDFVEVDTRAKTVLMNGDPSGNRYSWLDLSQTVWGTLRPGSNLLHFQASSATAHCTVSWTPTYL